MRRAVYIALACLALSTGPAAAQRSVLLPSDDTGSSGNTSSSVLPSAPAPTTTAQGTTKPAAPSSPTLPSQPGAPSIGTVKNTTMNSIHPGGAVDQSVTKSQNSDLMKALSRKATVDPMSTLTPSQRKMVEAVRAQAQAARPPNQFVDEVDTSELRRSILPPPYAATIMVGSNYVWGQRDATTITTALGYKPEEIPANCQLRLEVRVVTDKPSNIKARIMAGDQARVGFDGTPTSVSMLPMAICQPPKNVMPNGGMVIMRVGKMYGLRLASQPSCPITSQTRSASGPQSGFTMQIDYNGDGKVNCK